MSWEIASNGIVRHRKAPRPHGSAFRRIRVVVLSDAMNPSMARTAYCNQVNRVKPKRTFLRKIRKRDDVMTLDIRSLVAVVAADETFVIVSGEYLLAHLAPTLGAV